MSYPGSQRRGRLALPIIASLTLGLAALPALGAAPQAHAATARQVAHGQRGHATHAKPLQAQPTVAQTYLPVPFPAPTASIVVTNCTTAGLNSLYAALQTSATISFNCAPGGGSHVINLGDTFKVTNGEVLTIDGSDGGRNDIVLTGGATVVGSTDCPIGSDPSKGGHQIFFVDYGSSLTLNNLTLTDGYAYSGDSSGGAVEAFGNFSANRDTFTSNGAVNYGGALELATDSSTHGQVSTITNSTFDSNYTNCHTGGAIDVDQEGDGGPQQVTLTHDTLTNNISYADDGGALYANNDNTSSLVSVANSVFRNNQAEYQDGQLGGGAIATYDQLMSITSTLFDNNYVTGNGGAVYIGEGNSSTTYLTTISNSTFVQNRANGVGGAIYDEASLRITNSTITANSSGFDGSAIFYAGGKIDLLTVAASTINANSSDSVGDFNGAAIVNVDDGSGPLSIGTSIVYNNTTLDLGSDSKPLLRTHRVPVHANVAGTVIECSGPIVDNGHNLSDYDVRGTPATNSCGFTQIAPPAASPDILVQVGTDIKLGPLGAYGGPTLGAPGNTSPTYTERLLTGSPAIDAVPTNLCVAADGTTPLPTDQRGAGFVRPYVTACDIGAFEVSVLGGTPCSVFIGFFSPGGIGVSLRTGDTPTTVVSYLSLSGPAGQVLALPLVPRLQVADTLSCTTLDPNAPGATSPVTTVTVDARVARSGNPALPVGTLLRVVATRTLTAETMTVSAINPGGTTGAILYTLTNYVQPNSFVVRSTLGGLYLPPVQ